MSTHTLPQPSSKKHHEEAAGNQIDIVNACRSLGEDETRRRAGEEMIRTVLTHHDIDITSYRHKVTPGGRRAHMVGVRIPAPSLHWQDVTVTFTTDIEYDETAITGAVSPMITLVKRRRRALMALRGTSEPFGGDWDTAPMDHITVELHALPYYSARDDVRSLTLRLGEPFGDSAPSRLARQTDGVYQGKGPLLRGTHLTYHHPPLPNGMHLADLTLTLPGTLPTAVLTACTGRRVGEIASGAPAADYVVTSAAQADGVVRLRLRSQPVSVIDAGLTLNPPEPDDECSE